ncbi:DsbA family protein [Methylobacterium brachiatum]
MTIDRRSLIALGAASVLGPASADAGETAETAARSSLDVVAGTLPDKFIGDGGRTLYVYLSLGCPSCARFHASTLPELRRSLVGEGGLRIVYREFPLDVRAFAAAMIVRKSGDRYFDALDLLFAEQATWVASGDPGPIFRRLAAQVGVDREAYDATMVDRPLYEGLSAIKEQARRLGVRGTPTLFVRGRKIEGDLPASAIASEYAGDGSLPARDHAGTAATGGVR